MRHYLTVCLLSAGAAFTSSAYAQSDSTLSCEDLQIPITGVPDTVPLTFTIPTDDLIKQCTSSTKSTLTLLTPTSGVTITVEPGAIQVVPFTVKDDSGHQVTAKLVITRDQGNS